MNARSFNSNSSMSLLANSAAGDSLQPAVCVSPLKADNNAETLSQLSTQTQAKAKTTPKTTPLFALHQQLGARMVEFAGYHMPLQYATGVLAEHRHTRHAVGLFDVSHMGQILVQGPQAAQALETLLPLDCLGLAPGQQRYTVLTADDGGILDDLIVTRRSDDFLLIVNAARKDADLDHLLTHIGHLASIQACPNWALLAVQGPQAATVLARRVSSGALPRAFMHAGSLCLTGVPCTVFRSGYTGEDGFEISLPNEFALEVAQDLLSQPEVAPIGLGARDTLRLEAGLCLYGQDIHEQTSPVQAGLGWVIDKVRRTGERSMGYPGAAIIESHFTRGTALKRVGLKGLERVVVRAGATLLDEHEQVIGSVTSGSFSPSLEQAIAMAYVNASHASPGCWVKAQVRGALYPMQVCPLPFIKSRVVRLAQPIQ